MTPDRPTLLARIGLIRLEASAAAASLAESHSDELGNYRQAISRGVTAALADLEAGTRDISGNSAVCASWARSTAEYLDWLQWAFWDLPHFAFALGTPIQNLERGVGSCGLVYLSMRIFDDLIDRHYIYRKKQPTLLTLFEANTHTRRNPEGLAALAGLLACFEGLCRLAESPAGEGLAAMQSTVRAIRKTVIGAAMEQSPPEAWDQASYRRLIQLKNVEFWKALFAAVDPTQQSSLFPFLERYYLLAQKLNDVQDYRQDLLRAQPNLITVWAAGGESGGPGLDAALAAVENELGEDLAELADAASRLPMKERLVAFAKLGETIEESMRLGLFGDPEPHAPSAPQQPIGLQWYSTLEDVIEKVGPGELFEVHCAVCTAARRRLLFVKQGFSFHRCLECSHIYVSPRIRSELSGRLGAELDQADCHASILEVQKYYAAPICHLLRSRAPGNRLLDIGFGRGYLLQLAQSYGFEVYGVDSSQSLVDAMRPALGRRLVRARIGDDRLPWQSFDVIVVSHVLEHLDAPGEFLQRCFEALNPEGVLYVAVPDMESVNFRIFGKQWEVVSPLAHLQYFTQKSLSKLLERHGFTDTERIEQPRIPIEIAPRWIRLMRQLGGTDSGELAMLAVRPPAD